MSKKQAPLKTPDTSQFDNLVKKAQEEAISSGLVPDYNKINEEAGGAITSFQGAQGLYSIEKPDFYDAYEDYVDRNTLRGGQFDADALNAIRAENQSNWEQAGNALGRLAINIVPQIIGSAAAMLYLPGYFSAEEAANNSIVKWADSIKQASNEALPIYEEHPEYSMQMGDFAWWMSRGEGLVESIASFAASGAGAGKLVALGAKGLARALAATIMSAKKAQQVAGVASTLGTATMMNQAEAVLEATQVYQTTYNNSLAKGKSATQAKEDAARAAATSMNINRVNILLNLTSAAAFLKPIGGTRNLITAPTKMGTIGKIVGEGAQEALEETINLVAQKAGEAKGRGEKDYMAQGMKAISTMEGLEAAFLGAIGGVGNTAITSALHGSKYGPGAVVDENGNRISYNENLRQQYQKQQQVIEELKQNGVKVTDALMNVKERMQFEDELYQAARAGDQAKVEELQEKMFENTALKAFSSGTTDILEEQLKEEMTKDPAEVGEEYILNAKQALENLTELENIYNNFENYKNVNEIFYNRAQEQRLNRASSIIGKQTKNAQVSFAQKVRDIAQKYKFTEEYDQIDKVEGEEVARRKQTRETPLNYVFDDLENNQGDSEENKKTYDKFLKEVKATPEYEFYEGYKAQLENIEASLASNQTEFQNITSPKYQEEYANKQAEKELLKTLNADLANAATITDVEKLKAQTNNETFNQLADQKIAEIEKSNAAEAKRKQTELTLQELRAKIKAGTEETYDEVDKAIEDADISQANKDALRMAHSNHLKQLANPQAANPLAMFNQGENEEDTTTLPLNTTQAVVNQNNKNLATQLPTDLPQPSVEVNQVENEVINTAETLVQSDPTLLLGQDENGNLIFNYSKSAEGYNRGAFLSRDFNQEESLGIVDREEFTNELEDNPIVLDPDALVAGTKLILSVDHDYDGVKYDPTSTTREKTSWIARLAELRQLATQRNVALEQLPEYIAEVPIKVMTETGETVFYVHDNAWYRNENLDNTPEAIQNDKSKNYKIRQAVVKKGTVKSQVSYKSYGRLFKTADGKSIPLTEAMPDSKLVIAVGKDGSYEFADDPKNLLGKKYKILNKQDTQPGRPYAIVKVGPNEHIAIPLERNKVSAEVARSIRFAVEAYLTGDANNPVVQAIGAATGIDITDALGLGQYMNMFTYIFPLDKNADLETLLMQGGSKSALKSTTPIITVNPNGIEFGIPGVMGKKYVDTNGVEQQRYGASISRNFEGTTLGKRLNRENASRLEKIIEKALSNVRIEALMQNTPAVIVLDNQGQTRSDNYLDHIKASTSSNVISANIGTEEDPKWIYTIQPTILFETKFAGNLASKAATTAKKVPTSVPNATPAAPIVVQPVAPVAAPVATQPTATAAKTDTEVELFSETDSKGRTFTYFSNTKEKDGLIKTTFTFNRSDKDASQRATAVSGIPVEKALGNKYTINEEYIPEGAKVVGVSEIRISKTGAAATVTYKVDGETYQGEVALNSNTTYDAGLAALEQPLDIETKKAEIEQLEKEKKQLLSTQQVEQSYTPKAVVGYTGMGWNTTDSKKINVSLYRLEKDSKDSNTGLLYFDPELEMAFKRSLNFPDSTFKKFYDEANEFNKDINGIRTIKPAKVTRDSKGNIEVLEKGVIEYVNTSMKDSSLSRPSTGITTKIDTTEIDSKINKAKEELNKLENEAKLAKLDAMNASMASSMPSAAKPQIVSELDNEAEQILDQEGLKLSDIEGFITNINNNLLPAEWYTNVGFRDASHALQVFERAAELFKERANQDVKTITLPNGLTVKVDKNTKDANSISDDSFDDMLVSLSEDQVDTVVAEVRNNVIDGVDPNTQDSLKAYIAADIMKRALALKEVGDKKSLETGPVFAEHKKSLKELAKFYREAGFPNKAAKLEAVVNQYDKLISIVNQYMNTLSTGKVSENLELNDNEESVGLEKTVYSDDWAFTINSKATASSDLRKFFAFVEARNADGTVMTNALGFPEIIPFDQVYDALHMMLANKPADLDIMMDTLELYAEKAPWVQTVIDNLEKAPERIKNEFVSDMTKHHIGMNFIMWTKDNNGRYSLQRWNSNSSSIEERLRDTWYSNLRSVGSNLLVLNDEDQYEYNAEVADDLISLAKSWEKDPKAVTDDELAQWLGNFGIVLSENTYKDLRAGKYNNSGRKPWTTLFTASTGLVKVLATELQKAVEQGVLVDDHKILKDSAIKALAKLEAINTNNVYSNSFRSGVKTIYSYGNNNYLVNRMRDLTNYDEDSKKFLNPDLIENLKAISFSQDSIWLNNLVDEGEMGTLMRGTLSADYLSLEALKQQYTKSKDNRKLNNLNTDEHEIVKLGMFFNGSKIKIGNKYYRRVSYLYPTMSDKTTMLTINALAETITVTTEGLAKSNLETLYNALVQPEINRIQGKKSKNISGYTPEYFYFLPSLNTLEVEINGVDFANFRDLVINGNQRVINEVKDQVLEHLQQTFNQLVDQKLEDWDILNIGKTLKDSNNRTTDQYTFLDKEYMKSHAKGVQNQKVYHAAADYVFNSLVANSEIMKLFTGDPALYAKFKEGNTLAQNLEATFINMGKRLAGDIAPGIELADSASNSYFQVFLEDQKIDSNNLKDKVQAQFFEGIDPKYRDGYSKIEGSDAQEYTTWKEHLYVLKQLGRLTQAQYDKLTDKLTKQSAGIINKSTKLTYEETQVVLQPMKPVYVGNIASREDNADRRVYIKSSSFPLVPEFTTGFQINKLRAALEKFEEDNKNSIAKDGSPKFVRASFGTANKVGAVSKPIAIFDKDGNVLDNLSITKTSTLELPRSNFRIQQDVPYKREKNEINIGTQERKLLFVNLLDVKIADGKTGNDLMAEYNTAYEELFKHAQEKLMKQLGLVEEVAAQDVLQQFNDIAVDATTVEKTMEALDTISKIKSPIKKQTAIEEIEEEIGADNLERINFINQNFDKIVEGLVNSKINYFFDDNNEFKNCD